MDIKSVVVLLIGLVLASVHSADAQRAKVATIGWLTNRPDTTEDIAGRGTSLRQMLAELGYGEGKNIAFEFRSADNKPDRFPALVDELINRR